MFLYNFLERRFILQLVCTFLYILSSLQISFFHAIHYLNLQHEAVSELTEDLLALTSLFGRGRGRELDHFAMTRLECNTPNTHLRLQTRLSCRPVGPLFYTIDSYVYQVEV
jgi:hypothetical protein